MRLIEVPIEKAISGELYLTKMKHGWISGIWDDQEGTCHKYYWRDMSWYPNNLYKIVDDDGEDVT